MPAASRPAGHDGRPDGRCKGGSRHERGNGRNGNRTAVATRGPAALADQQPQAPHGLAGAPTRRRHPGGRDHCVARYAHTRDRRRAREYRDAREWLLDDRRDWMFSFHNVCELLSLEARAVRVWVLTCSTSSVAPRPPIRILAALGATARWSGGTSRSAGTAPRTVSTPGALRAPRLGRGLTDSPASARRHEMTCRVVKAPPFWTIPARHRHGRHGCPHRWRPCLHFFEALVAPAVTSTAGATEQLTSD